MSREKELKAALGRAVEALQSLLPYAEADHVALTEADAFETSLEIARAIIADPTCTPTNESEAQHIEQRAEIERLREAVYGPCNMEADETLEARAKRNLDEMRHERDRAQAEIEKLTAARDFGLGEVQRWMDEACAQKDARRRAVAALRRAVVALQMTRRCIVIGANEGPVYCNKRECIEAEARPIIDAILDDPDGKAAGEEWREMDAVYETSRRLTQLLRIYDGGDFSAEFTAAFADCVAAWQKVAARRGA